MNPTPATQLPTVREGTTFGFRFSVGTWCAIIGTVGSGVVVLVGFAIWLHTIYRNQELQTEKQTIMQRVQESQGEVLNRMERSLSEIEFRQKYNITTTLPGPAPLHP